ncbi:phosphatase PAP2 family protein [Serinicoccus kebangsaanensis]|uniref:phosphatase PAP2 family protein n=1 Tax=Serinicoccus kebangsaanensis TaxID=2602069 RepID=UPI00178C5A09|nr:phosphatase PAP2 family protein [Serinicoccus kebangsaanensis]
MVSFRRLTSLPALTGALVLVTLLVAGPLREFDRSLHGFWSDELTPRWTDFLDQVPNAVSGQAVCLPVLLLVAFTLAWKHRTWRPILIAGATEAGFYGVVGGLKLLLARTSPKADDVSARFFNGGAEEHGWYGMTYPSGHASEAILIYGAAAYLIAVYADQDSRVVKRLGWAMALISVNSIGVAYYLGYHWPSDLIGGMLVGAVVLRAIIDVDQWLVRRRTRITWERILRERETATARPTQPVPTPQPEAAPQPQPVPAPAALVPAPEHAAPGIPSEDDAEERHRVPELVP